MKTISVNASKNYNVYVNSGLNEFKNLILPKFKGKNIAVITDQIVENLYLNDVCRLLDGFNVVKLVVNAGEESKNFENYFNLINALAKNEFTRLDGVITLGGGVVTDLGGFVASTYMRGITLVAMPTTLLASVDASVGGKTAINLSNGKNMCGTFYQPDAVYINTQFLKSLPQSQIQSGMGEIIKYAFLDDKIAPGDLSLKDLENTIYKCVLIKRDIVESDEKESGVRKLLNLGHTVGHAIEKLSNYSISHGECVVIGIKYAILLSQKLFNLNENTIQKMNELLNLCGHNLKVDFSAEDIAKQLIFDKKRLGDKISFVLLKEIGKPEIVDIKVTQLKELLCGL